MVTFEFTEEPVKRTQSDTDRQKDTYTYPFSLSPFLYLSVPHSGAYMHDHIYYQSRGSSLCLAPRG